MRQIAFSPSIEGVSESNQLTDYDVQFKGLNVKDADLSNLKGRVILLNYWATWCPPCVAELPSIQSLYNDYKDKVFFIFVTNDSWSIVNRFYQERGYNLPTYRTFSKLPKILDRSNTIPTTYLIDKKGFIRIYKTGFADWNSKSFRTQLNQLIKN